MATLTFWRPFSRRFAPDAETRSQPAPETPSEVRRGRLLVGIGIVALMGAIAISVRPVGSAESPRYRTETVTSGPVTGVLRLPATLEPRSVVRISAASSGRVTSVRVNPGDVVKRGQVLARLDDGLLRAEADGATAATVGAQATVRQAELRLALLLSVLEQAEEIAEAPPEIAAALAELEVEALDAQAVLVKALAELKQTEAVARASRIHLRRSVVRAPMDGVVVERLVEPGDTVAPSPALPMFVLSSDPRRMRMVANVNGADAARVQGGSAEFVVPAFGGRSFQAAVRDVAVVPTSEGDQYRVLLDVENDTLDLRAGMSAVLNLPSQAGQEALVVPQEALRYAPNGGAASGPAVWVLDHGEPRRIPVQLGVVAGNQVEVRRAPLQPGASVIVGVTSP